MLLFAVIVSVNKGLLNILPGSIFSVKTGQMTLCPVFLTMVITATTRIAWLRFTVIFAIAAGILTWRRASASGGELCQIVRFDQKYHIVTGTGR